MKTTYMKTKLFFIIPLLMTFMGQAQNIQFEDNNFKAELLEASADNFIAKNAEGEYFKIDANSDDQISENEARLVAELFLPNNSITSLAGIEKFINIRQLDCSINQISSLDLSKNTNLNSVKCQSNQLSGLDISNLSKLTVLECSDNQLTSLIVSNNTSLKELNCGKNKIEEINLSENLALEILICNNNKLANINVANNTLLKEIKVQSNILTGINVTSNVNLINLFCQQNEIENINVNQNVKLEEFVCGWNKLTTIDVSNNAKLIKLHCESNQIEIINHRNKSSHLSTIGANFYFQDNPPLKYICVDEDEYDNVAAKIVEYGYSQQTTLNSYCSFKPTGHYYTIKGDFNTCGNKENPKEKLKYKVEAKDGETQTIIANTPGSYTLFVEEGEYTITPILELPKYYQVTPERFIAVFPGETDILTQDICMGPIPNINDLEIALTPVGTPARPGFDSEYKIVYRNKGTTTLNGSVTLDYFDDVLDLTYSSPDLSSYGDYQLIWTFSNLKPFEKREIDITFNVNSPMETPAVNNNDLLSFTAKVNPIEGDEKPEDNVSSLRQTVVGSYDPNDKLCMEGQDVLEEMIGKYVHYRIRFENTGTFAAENIIVVDSIDTSKFDIESFVPLHSSHPYETKITGNKVEFIFENIQLPFDDANNDGYVFFKIKTLPSLKLGDSFSNKASIYFDFNFPIITNNETTTIVEEHLGVSNFEFNDDIIISPNPTKDIIEIRGLKGNKPIHITIYSIEGKKITSLDVSPHSNYNISHLPSGMYIIQFKFENGVVLNKIIKE